MKHISMRKVQKERERKEREKKYTWVRDWNWEDVIGLIWIFGNNRLVKKGEEGTLTIAEAGGLTSEASLYCETFKSAALGIGLIDGPEWDRNRVRPGYEELFNEIDEGCEDVRKELKDAKTTEERVGLVGTYTEEAEKVAETGDRRTAARLYSKAGTLSTRLLTARNYISGAITYLYFLRTRGYGVQDMGPDSLREYLGTPERSYKDGVLQQVQHEYRYKKNVRDKVGWYFRDRHIQNMEKAAKDFAREVLIPRGVFDALDEDRNRVIIPPFKTGVRLSAAEPIPYRITLDKNLKFPRDIFTKRGKLIPDVNEVLLIYNAIHKIKSGWGIRDPMNKFVKNRCLYEILIRILRESGARPANIRWLKWGDFITNERHPYISWVAANEQREPGKKPPDITYLSNILAEMIDAYRGTRKLDPNAFFIRDEFFVRKKVAEDKPVTKQDLGRTTTASLQQIIETAYKDKPDVIATLGSEVGAKRFRKSLATLLFGTIKDTSKIPALTGDTIETLEKFYTEEKSAKSPRIRIDRDAKGKHTEFDISEKIFDKELPPGVKRTELIRSCKLPRERKRSKGR